MRYTDFTQDELETIGNARYNAFKARRETQHLTEKVKQVFNAQPTEWRSSGEGQKFACMIETLDNIDSKLRAVAVMLREDEDTE